MPDFALPAGLGLPRTRADLEGHVTWSSRMSSRSRSCPWDFVVVPYLCRAWRRLKRKVRALVRVDVCMVCPDRYFGYDENRPATFERLFSARSGDRGIGFLLALRYHKLMPRRREGFLEKWRSRCLLVVERMSPLGNATRGAVRGWRPELARRMCVGKKCLCGPHRIADDSSGFVTRPRLNSMPWSLPPRLTSTFIQSESALTHETPTPWSPPDTL